MNAGARHSRQPNCPVCESLLTETEFDIAITKLQKEAAALSSRLLRSERKTFAQTVKKIKTNHKERIGAMKKNQSTQKRLFRKKLREHKSKHKKKLDQELARMKRHYQIQAENIRDFYINKYTTNQKGKASFDSSELDRLPSRYDATFNMIIARLDAIHEILVHSSQVKQSTPEARSGDTLAVSHQSEMASYSDEEKKLQMLKEIAEIIKTISAERKKTDTMYDNTNAV